MWWVWAIVGCGGAAPAGIDVAAVPGALDVTATGPMSRVEAFDADGAPITALTLPSPSATASLLVSPPPGASWTVRATFASGEVATTAVVAPAIAADLAVEAPIGGARVPVGDGDVVRVARVGDARAAVVATARGPLSLVITVDGDATTVALPVAGARADMPLVGPGPHAVVVQGDGGRTVRFTVAEDPIPPDAVRIVGEPVLPADPRGRPDATLPPDAIVAPAPGWTRALARLGLGVTGSASAPRTWQAVTVANAASVPVDAVVRAEVVDGDGAPVPAFRSRVRDQVDQPYVSVLVRVPAQGQAVAVLPVYVDEAALGGTGMVTRRIALAPLGAPSAVDAREAPLAVVVGRWSGPAGLGAALVVSACGWTWVGAGARRFLASTPTVDLVTIAMFAALTGVVGAAFQLAGMVVGAVLGPFAPLVTGLPDDAFRAVLLATLLTLLPRPGVFAAATAIGFLMRAIVVGGLHPVDLAYVGSAIGLHELGLWLAGITRPTGWRDGPASARWLRLTLGLGVPNAVAVLLGLATAAMLYRLYFAGWYVAALALVPGFAYVAGGCALAEPIARHLRRIAP